MDIFLQKGTNLTVDTELGYSILSYNVGETLVTQSIVIQPKKQFLFWQKKLDAALDSGRISQSIYDIITTEQDESRQVYEISSDLAIEKQFLIDLADRHTITITPSDNAAKITKTIINAGYQIVKKI